VFAAFPRGRIWNDSGENHSNKRLKNKESINAEIVHAKKLLPTWLTWRMMDDQWLFGLLMVTGEVWGIECIDRVRQDASGALWIDVTLLDKDTAADYAARGAPTSRLKASFQVAHIVGAFELADT
jgi:hypothetical protein